MIVDIASSENEFWGHKILSPPGLREEVIGEMKAMLREYETEG